MRKWIWALVAVMALALPTAGAIWTDTRPSHAAENIVKMDPDKFDPAEITVAPGGAVTWQNVDQTGAHTAKAQDGSFDTGYVGPGEKKSVTLSKAGDFPYYCELHPYKKGTVHVK
jgi:plastocyanin